MLVGFIFNLLWDHDEFGFNRFQEIEGNPRDGAGIPLP